MKALRLLACCLFAVINLYGLNSLAADKDTVIRLATTTSVLNSGLLHQLKAAFEANTGYILVVDAVGTGRALRRAREGNTDVIIVHSPIAEQKFMREGFGLVRLPLMSNEFILVGPETDPARVMTQNNIVDAFKAIAETRTRFVSRGDDSGTHKKELDIWKNCRIEPHGKWYIEYGQDMARTTAYADKMAAYILVDRGTWLALRDQIKLVPLFKDDALLDNPYHIISVNPDNQLYINEEGAQRFILWMTSKPGQDIIRSFTINGEQLFTPAGNS